MSFMVLFGGDMLLQPLSHLTQFSPNLICFVELLKDTVGKNGDTLVTKQWPFGHKHSSGLSLCTKLIGNSGVQQRPWSKPLLSYIHACMG